MKPFSLFLFSTDPELIRKTVSSGVNGLIIDWESAGKEERQASADTQINRNTLDDLCRVRASTEAKVICRINAFGETTAEEVEQVIEAGANEIFLPMVKTVEEVKALLDFIRNRCGAGILVETSAAVRLAGKLAGLPLSRVYVGLNDLAIERKSKNIFSAVADGTVDRLRSVFRHIPFGFGGLTIPELGCPIPCRLLIGEMARINCNFSFLRRSFHRDIQGRDLSVEIPHILEAIRLAYLRSSEAVERDRHDLEVAIHNWELKKTSCLKEEGNG